LAQAQWCRQVFGDRLSMALELPLRHPDDCHRGTVAAMAAAASVEAAVAISAAAAPPATGNRRARP
ncbi:hypothetical protein, partial [Ralstonia pseudosolanacearum]|uniref:hypothetical protein n=1 Tax=Ralstonia pseudosolanacearum TaxID=1310165 RepID=UPI003CEF13B9